MKVPILICCALALLLTSRVHAQTFGSWAVGVSGSSLYAATVNDSGNLLGQYCFPADGSCFWLLGMKTSCNEGDRYPVLANSDAGASHMEVLCSAKLDNGMYRYVFTDFDKVDAILSKGSRVGFAIPLDGDQFRVVRFNITDSNSAVARMKTTAEKAQQLSPRSPSGTRDQTL
jgi:hypothetical protein